MYFITILWWFLPYISMNWLQVYMCSPHPEATSLSTLSLWLSQSTCCGCPASFIELALVIYFKYGNVYVSVLFSQIISHSPSLPWVQKSALYICRLCCPAYKNCWYCLSKFHVYVDIQYLSFFFWLTLLCVIGSRFIYLLETDSNAFLFIAE